MRLSFRFFSIIISAFHILLFFSLFYFVFFSFVWSFVHFKEGREEKIHKSLRIKLPALPEPNDDHLDTYIKVVIFFSFYFISSVTGILHLSHMCACVHLCICIFASHALRFIPSKTTFLYLREEEFF